MGPHQGNTWLRSEQYYSHHPPPSTSNEAPQRDIYVVSSHY